MRCSRRTGCASRTCRGVNIGEVQIQDDRLSLYILETKTGDAAVPFLRMPGQVNRVYLAGNPLNEPTAHLLQTVLVGSQIFAQKLHRLGKTNDTRDILCACSLSSLYVESKVNLLPFIEGGAQERGKRAGTENIPGIVGFAKAVELLSKDLAAHQNRLQKMSSRLIQRITSEIDSVYLTGHPQKRHSGIASFCFEYVEGEAIVLDLNFADIYASTGSACTTGSAGASHVLEAMNIPDMISHGSLRLSVGHFNSLAEVDQVVEVLKKSIKRLRVLSPLCD